jgi:RimJ/RimL family protein N-acetyltransferase
MSSIVTNDAFHKSAGGGSGFYIRPLTRPEARQILSWRYDAPYDFYNPPVTSAPDIVLDRFVSPENAFHSIRDELNRFVGFCSFGLDGRVLGGIYPEGPLDLGLGMRPEETSRGKGRAFFQAIVDFAWGTYQPNSLRLSVAQFNERAIRVYESLGFEHTAEFLEVPSQTPYLIMEFNPAHG